VDHTPEERREREPPASRIRKKVTDERVIHERTPEQTGRLADGAGCELPHLTLHG